MPPSAQYALRQCTIHWPGLVAGKSISTDWPSSAQCPCRGAGRGRPPLADLVPARLAAQPFVEVQQHGLALVVGQARRAARRSGQLVPAPAGPQGRGLRLSGTGAGLPAWTVWGSALAAAALSCHMS